MFRVGVSERMKDERAHSAEVLITLVGVLRHPLVTQPHLKAASSGEHHTELGADFCLLELPRPERDLSPSGLAGLHLTFKNLLACSKYGHMISILLSLLHRGDSKSISN